MGQTELINLAYELIIKRQTDTGNVTGWECWYNITILVTRSVNINLQTKFWNVIQ